MAAKRWRARGLWALLILAGMGGALAGAASYALNVLRRPGPLAANAAVVVPRGGAAEVADALAREGVLGPAWQFRVAAALTENEGALRAGEFALPAHASLRDVLTVLRAGRVVQHRLTLPEGLTARQLAPIIAGADAAEGDVPVFAEGALLPQTYAFPRGEAREALVQRAQAAMARALAEAWEARAPDLPLASAREALILASIVERETARPAERAHVAAVFLNRLRAGMKLQSDPTVVFAASDGLGALDRPLSRADLDRDDAYNTYRVAGLPPGPICAPGVASIRATLHPDGSDDLYFVADGSGGHAFARTLDDHLRNVARWRGLVAARPG